MGNYYSRSDKHLKDSKQTTMSELMLELDSQELSIKEEFSTNLPSESECQTPQTPVKEFIEKMKNIGSIQLPAINDCENPKMALKSKLSKEFSKKFNELDPRSPNQFINRTPIIFDDENDEINESSMLNDTFSNLFINNDNELQSSPIMNKETEILINKENIKDFTDPRSPSIGFERTPIIFSDDSNNENYDVFQIEKPKQKVNPKVKKNLKKSKKITKQIYEDGTVFIKCSTPKKNEIQNKIMKRTPLGCMENLTGRKNIDLKNKKY